METPLPLLLAAAAVAAGVGIWLGRRAAYQRMVDRLGPVAKEAYDHVFAGEARN